MIKICGLRTPEHACAAADYGADMLGMILAPSRRQISIAEVAQIREALERRPGATPRPKLVGVFVHADEATIREAIRYGGIDVVQMSGDEPFESWHALCDIPLIKAVRLDGRVGEDSWLADGPHHEHVRLMVEAHVQGSYGGTGVTGDWDAAAALARRRQIILAGGLTPENATAAVGRVQPWGVDVSSGVETNGIKDLGKIQAFIAAARAAMAQTAAVQGGFNA